MAKSASEGSSSKKASSQKHGKQPGRLQQTPAPIPPKLTQAELQKLDLPTDLQEADQEILVPDTSSGTQLWFLQFPEELEMTEGMTWDVRALPDGRLSATCEDDEGTSYTLTEQAKELTTPMFTVPSRGSAVMPKIVKTMKVTKTENMLPDPTAAAELVQAAMPSAAIPGIAPLPQALAEAKPASAAAKIKVPKKSIQKQQAQQQHQAERDVMASHEASKDEHKKAKSESKKLKKRAQAATAENERQSKMQRQSSAPLLEPAPLEVAAAPIVQSEAAKIHTEEEAAPKSDIKKDKKKRKKDKSSKHKTPS